MLGRKIISALLASIIIVLVLAAITNANDGPVAAKFGQYLFIYSIYVFPPMFVYGILTSSISEWLSAKHRQYARVWSLLYHIGIGILFFIPLNIFSLVIYHEVSGIGLRFILLCGGSGGVFFIVDRLVSRFWDKHK